MAKKPRSQRRKKGSYIDADQHQDGDSAAAAAAAAAAGIGDVADVMERLSDSHTVADTISTVGDDFDLDITAPHQQDDIDNLLNSPSAASMDNAAAAAASRQSRLMECITSIAEYSTEKRTAKREAKLRRLFRALTQFATGTIGQDTVEMHLDSITAACLYGLRAGVASPAEQYAACRVLEATGVVLGGGDHDDYCDSIETQLRRVVGMTGRATPVRGAALRALSLVNFMCVSDDVKTESLLDLCEAVAAEEFRNEPVPAALRAAALDCWCLLSTTIEDVYIADQSDVHIGRGLVLLPTLLECLNTANVDLRSAAGECVALIHECRLNLGIDDKQAEHASTTERRYRRGSWDGSEWEILMDEVKQRIAELSVESGYHMSKKAKKAQRATFREFMSTIVDDEPPCEVITFRGGTLTLRSWREVIQLNFIRHCLQSGFQIQLLTNETLHEVFSANGHVLNDLATMTQLEKRLTMSKTSEAAKAADQKMAKNRAARQNQKNLFIDAED